MPRKKSGKKAAREFKATLARIESFTQEIKSVDLGDQATTWAYEAALLKTAVAFEHLMLNCIVTAINNDTRTISQRTGVVFPKHLTDEVCEYLVTGGGFFNFRGRDGLIREIKSYVPNDHWLHQAVKNPQHTKPLDQMISLRNFAAHESPASKRNALEVLKQRKLSSAGAWIKRQQRFATMVADLTKLADEVEAAAPY